MELLGREEEQKIFKHHLRSSESKLIVIYGRRRVGKTFLIRKYFADKILFEVSGLYQGEMEDQLSHFNNTLAKHGYYEASVSKPSSWMAAFDRLGLFIDSIKHKRKKVIFIDELPWLDTPRSKFLMAFENFWNSYCSKRRDLIVVICGSAASWMIKKILKNKGGLHNRVSEKINLRPFNLSETERFLRAKGIIWSKYSIVQLYMIFGGVPYYLDAIRKGESLPQVINRVCFIETGLLYNEYDQLYSSLFTNSEQHRQIARTLSKTKKGLTRQKMIQLTGLPSGGTLSKTLEELEKSGFIKREIPYGTNQNNSLYQLIDHFTLFYLQFMSIKGKRIKDDWTKKINNPSWKSWSGFAFERICFAHTTQIKRALGLQAIESHISTWQQGPNDTTDGAQIDMVIDRADRIANVCEIKFVNAEYTIDKSYAKNLRNKLFAFYDLKSNKRKLLFLTMITTFGVKQNEYAHELVQNEITLSDLFKPS